MMKTPTNQVRSSEEGLAGVAALIIFIAIVLVGAITAAVILDVTGSLEQQAAQTGQDASNQISSTIQVLERTGQVSSTGDSLNQVSFVVSVAPGTPELNLANLTISATHTDGRTDIVDDGVALGDDPDDSGFHVDQIVGSGEKVITGSQQRYNITIPSGVESASGNSATGLTFEQSERVEFVLTSSQGGQSFQEVRVPSTLTAGDTVTL